MPQTAIAPGVCRNTLTAVEHLHGALGQPRLDLLADQSVWDGVHYDGNVALFLPNYSDRIVEVYKRMADATHDFDVPLLAQLGHRGRRVSDAAAYLGRCQMAPSAVPAPVFSAPMFVPHEMITDEVEGLVASFGAAAARVPRGGLDGIEISIGMDYLFANFLHPHGNRRQDKYGGPPLEERMAFLKEVLGATRAELGQSE